MNISTRQHELLAEIQRLALSAGLLTGRRVFHETQVWADGEVWSGVRAINDACDPIHDSLVAILPASSQRAVSGEGPASLIEQRDALVDWIAANRKQEAA